LEKREKVFQMARLKLLLLVGQLDLGKELRILIKKSKNEE
jgi:hypothetical protein